MSSLDSVDIRWRMESGEEHHVPAAAFLAGWTQNVGYFTERDPDLDRSTCFLGLYGVIGTAPRLRPFTDQGQVIFDGDSVDDDGVLVLPRGPELFVQIVDPDGRQVCRFPAGDGVAIKAGPNIPIEGAGHYSQELLCSLDGTILATNYRDGWRDAAGEPYPEGRGYILYVGDESWFELKDGHFHLAPAAQQRRRPSPLAARQLAAV